MMYDDCIVSSELERLKLAVFCFAKSLIYTKQEFVMHYI